MPLAHLGVGLSGTASVAARKVLLGQVAQGDGRALDSVHDYFSLADVQDVKQAQQASEDGGHQAGEEAQQVL